MDSNVGNIEFDGDGMVMSNGGSNRVGYDFLGGCSGVDFLQDLLVYLLFS